MPLFEQETQKIPSNLLKDRFGWPPFSILNTISGEWQKRKSDWNKIIQDSTLGRDTRRYNATPTNIFSSRGADAKEPQSISTFDPYLCELMYRWFSVDGSTVLDPFAGGVVRGAVAAILGRNYFGIDLSPEQVTADIEQYASICEKYSNISGECCWIQGDSEKVLPTVDKKYGMVFTCPPYYNLERYTYEPGELSRLPSYEAFIEKYTSILKLTADRLEDNSFFVIVVSEVRETFKDVARSNYVGLVPDTIHILRDECFLHYYNEIILENAVGSLPVRVPRSFIKTRKVGRQHQNVLVFYKGDIREIENKFGKENF